MQHHTHEYIPPAIPEVPIGSTAQRGIVQLYNNVDSTRSDLSATAYAVKLAYDRASAALSDGGVAAAVSGVARISPSSSYARDRTLPAGGTWRVISLSATYDHVGSQDDNRNLFVDSVSFGIGNNLPGGYVLSRNTNCDGAFAIRIA